jgi:putative GTP pyrophosphokinase
MINVFINKALQDTPAYEAWGGLVASEIMKGIILEHSEKEEFLRVPIKIRVKKESSIRGKIARYSGEKFEDVVKDMVGVRFVVLLTSELELVQDAIMSGKHWNAELVRHPDLQVDENPEHFSYQSIHYLLTSNKDIDEGKIRIRAGLTCEVQIRTLLQHAYAELTHDNIYKPTQLVPSKAKRFVARSMALMETTDDLFCRTLEELRSANLPRNELFGGLSRLFEDNGLWEETSCPVPFDHKRA